MYGIWCSNVTDIRKEALTEYVKSIISDNEIVLLSLNGDASFRRYFRVANLPYIAVDAPPETQKNREFVFIDKALEKASIRVPKIIAFDLEKGFMLLEDLGDVTFAKASAGDSQKAFYHKAVEELVKLTDVTFDEKEFSLPLFDEKFIRFELSLFDTWMLEKALNAELTAKERQELDECYEVLAQNCLLQSQTAMHRDYHSRNLMVADDTLCMIDFQDMVKGPVTYDLASIVYDCYINLDKELIEELTEKAFCLYTSRGVVNGSYADFKKSLLLTSLQRHVKVLGIFCRLSIRDGKDGYLKDLPRVINYVLNECDCDSRMLPLKAVVEKYVKGKF